MSTVGVEMSSLISLEDASREWNVHRSYFYRRTGGRKIPYYKIGRKVFFDRSELTMYMNRELRVEPIGR